MWGKITNKDLQTLKSFVDRFNVDYIMNEMQLDDYVMGKESKTSFCYIIERGLSFIGGIQGATAYKFGIYYGKTKSDPIMQYRYTKKFGNNKDEVFQNVKIELVSLINRTKLLKEFKDIVSLISGMFKYKIMYIYNPSILLPIYCIDDLAHFSNRLSLPLKKTFEEYQLQLIEYKNQNYPELDNLEFAIKMYDEFGRHLSKEEISVNEDKDVSLNEKLRKEKPITYIEYTTKPIKKVKPKVDKRNKVTYYPRDFKMAQVALIKSDYSCEYDKTHYCFERRKDNTRYTEVHHLIPLCYYEEFDNSLDVPENIVSLCSNCHNEIHYGKNADQLIKKLYEERKELLLSAGIYISLEQLLLKYKQINNKE